MEIPNLTQEEIQEIQQKDFRGGFFDKLLGGTKYAFKALVYMFERKLYMTFICEAVLMVFCYIFFVFALVGVILFFDLGGVLGQQNSTLMIILFACGGVFSLFYLLTASIQVIVSCFYIDTFRKVSEKTEKMMTGEPVDVKDRPKFTKKCFSYVCRYFCIGLVEGFIVWLIFLFTFLLLYIPFVNLIYMYFIMSVLHGYLSLKVIFIRRDNYWGLFKFWKQNFWFVIGLGLGSYLIRHFPILGTVFENFSNVIGGTKAYLHICHLNSSALITVGVSVEQPISPPIVQQGYQVPQEGFQQVPVYQVPQGQVQVPPVTYQTTTTDDVNAKLL